MKKALSIILVFILISYLTTPQTVYAATVKINRSKVELCVGDSTTLKLIAASGTIKWVSSDKKVASISKTGKLTAIAPGIATITASNNKKEYKCTVTVKDTTVTVTISGLLNKFNETAEFLNGIDYLKIVENEDDTITYTMTKDQQKAILTFIKDYFMKEIDEALYSDTYEGYTKTYTISDDVSIFDVYVDKEKYLSMEPNYVAFEPTVLMLMLLYSSYLEYSGIKEEDAQFKIHIYDYDTDELIDGFDENS